MTSQTHKAESTPNMIKRSQQTKWQAATPKSKVRKPWWNNRSFELVALPAGIVLLIALWAMVVYVGNYPTFILPHPFIVFAQLIEVTFDGTLWHHAQATLIQIIGGLLLGVSVATVLGYVLAKSPLLERLAGPYIVASQSVPVVAIAPLLVIWFGSGKTSKVIICALIVFFPILINTIIGIRSVDPGLRIMMRSLRANRWQMFARLEVPAAMPMILGGLKIGVTLSVIGAVVGEFVGADRGLGFLINLSKGLFDTPLMFAALIALAGISLVLYLIVTGLEYWLLAWRR